MKNFLTLFVLFTVIAVFSFASSAQTIAPFYAGAYTLRDIGAASDVPGRYGGLTFKPGTTNTLLIGGDGNTQSAKIYQVTVVRGANGHITGFSGNSSFMADAYGPDNGGIDGGLVVGPGNVLFYTTYGDNSIGQVKPGSTAVSKLTMLNPNSVNTLPWSVGSLVFVPAGMPGAGRLKILDYSAYQGGGAWWDTTVVPDGSGTYNFGSFGSQIPLNISCEGAFYVSAGNPRFTNHSVLICDYGGSSVYSYEVDNNGDPKPLTQRLFISDLSAPEGGTTDPVTGDFIFSSFDGNHVYIVTGFNGGLAAPVVNIIDPTNNTRFLSPASFDVQATATQSNGSISKVEFYLNGIYQITVMNPPYVLSVNNLAAGVYSFTAVAAGNGLISTSSPVVVTVTNPVAGQLSVVLTSPTNNTVTCDCTVTVIAANATNTSGIMPFVSFFNHNTNLLGTFSVPPYRLVLGSFGLATNKLTAVAFDGLGNSVTSSIVTVLVTGLVETNRLAIVDTSTNAMALCFRGLVNSNYVFEYATNVLVTNMIWKPFLTNVASPSTFGEISVADTNIQSVSRRFYRARKQ